jgi:hypothetical protein
MGVTEEEQGFASARANIAHCPAVAQRLRDLVTVFVTVVVMFNFPPR